MNEFFQHPAFQEGLKTYEEGRWSSVVNPYPRGTYDRAMWAMGYYLKWKW